MLELKITNEYKDEYEISRDYDIVVDGVTVGAISTIVDSDEVDEDGDIDYIYIYGLDIDPDYRNKGYGTQAIKAIAKEAWHFAYLAPTNATNQRLYARLGEETDHNPGVDQGFGIYAVEA